MMSSLYLDEMTCVFLHVVSSKLPLTNNPMIGG